MGGVLTGISERRAVCCKCHLPGFPSSPGVCSAQCELAGAGKREKAGPGTDPEVHPVRSRPGTDRMRWPPQSLALLSLRAPKSPTDPGASQPPGCLRSCPRAPGGAGPPPQKEVEGAGDARAEEQSRASGGAAVPTEGKHERNSSGVQGRGEVLQNAHKKVLQEETALDASRILLWQRTQASYHPDLCVRTEQPHSGAGRQEGSHPFHSFLSSHQWKIEKPTTTPPSTSHLVPSKVDKREELTLGDWHWA